MSCEKAIAFTGVVPVPNLDISPTIWCTNCDGFVACDGTSWWCEGSCGATWDVNGEHGIVDPFDG